MNRLLRIWKNYRAIRRSEFVEPKAALRQAIYLASPKPIPQIARQKRIEVFNTQPCQCGHFLGHHRKDETGSPYCISCRAISYHKAVDVDAEMWPEVIA